MKASAFAMRIGLASLFLLIEGFASGVRGQIRMLLHISPEFLAMIMPLDELALRAELISVEIAGWGVASRHMRTKNGTVRPIRPIQWVLLKQAAVNLVDVLWLNPILVKALTPCYSQPASFAVIWATCLPWKRAMESSLSEGDREPSGPASVVAP